MLLLLFRSGESLYAFNAVRVTEVVPRVPLREIPHAPPYLRGLMSYRGKAIPVIDFGLLIGGARAREVISTRVVLTQFTAHDGVNHLVGIEAENVNYVVSVGPEQIISPAMDLEEAPYLGAVLQLDDGLVQIVEADKLLTRRLQDALYGTPTEPS